jgi:hypothetical protein
MSVQLEKPPRRWKIISDILQSLKKNSLQTKKLAIGIQKIKGRYQADWEERKR